MRDLKTESYLGTCKLVHFWKCPTYCLRPPSQSCDTEPILPSVFTGCTLMAAALCIRHSTAICQHSESLANLAGIIKNSLLA